MTDHLRNGIAHLSVQQLDLCLGMPQGLCGPALFQIKIKKVIKNPKPPKPPNLKGRIVTSAGKDNLELKQVQHIQGDGPVPEHRGNEHFEQQAFPSWPSDKNASSSYHSLSSSK